MLPDLSRKGEKYIFLMMSLCGAKFMYYVSFVPSIAGRCLNNSKGLRWAESKLKNEIPFCVFQMELLKAKQEEDRQRLEEQFRADMEAQRVQMQNMMTANMDELRKDREAIVEQNQTLKQTMDQMRQAMDQRNDQIAELQKQIIAIKSRPPPPPPPRGGGGCVILWTKAEIWSTRLVCGTYTEGRGKGEKTFETLVYKHFKFKLKHLINYWDEKVSWPLNWLL